MPGVIDRMLQVPDAASLAAVRVTRERTGRHVGGSTGTNVWGALHLVAELRRRGEAGSVVTLICDGGERYGHTYEDDAWLAGHGLDPGPHLEGLRRFLDGGPWYGATARP